MHHKEVDHIEIRSTQSQTRMSLSTGPKPGAKSEWCHLRLFEDDRISYQ